MVQSDEQSAEICPVDHKTRSAWLQQNQPAKTTTTASPSTPNILEQHEALSKRHDRRVQIAQHRASTEQSSLPQTPRTRTLLARLFWAPPSITFHPASISKQHDGSLTSSSQSLSHTRTISTIPRASLSPTTTTPNPASTPSTAPPSNHESETGTSPSGHWVYPSERQFFDAMARKGHQPQHADMATIVPIHNAVNERAWREICAWEKPYGAKKCGGPRLVSFLGRGGSVTDTASSSPTSTSPSANQRMWTDWLHSIWGHENMTPRARWRTLMGYLPPFDRHDWVIDRCGTHIEYVIDFYSGKPAEGLSQVQTGDANAAAGGAAGSPQKLSFYLDVRPKLNSWEGWKMRTARLIGLT